MMTENELVTMEKYYSPDSDVGLLLIEIRRLRNALMTIVNASEEIRDMHEYCDFVDEHARKVLTLGGYK